MGGEPGDGIPGGVLVFKGLLEFPEEVVPGSEGYGGTNDCIFSEGISPGQGGPFGHVQEGEHDFLCVGVIGFFINHKVKLDGVHPQDGSVVGAIEGFGFANLELSGFDSGRQHRGRGR